LIYALTELLHIDL